MKPADLTLPSGVVVVDKPAGWTSHQVVGRARRLFGTRKIGHAGTLDPMATGVLLLGVNRATRLLGHLALHDKAYTATIRLGQATNTDDADGEVTAETTATHLANEDIAAQIAPLSGDIWQRPSSFSAIKVNGKRAYALARSGEDVQLPKRQVNVNKFELLSTRRVGQVIDLDVAIECSSGTYIRALARDLGTALGVGGHLTALRRTRIGRYGIGDAVELAEQAPPMMTMADAARLSFACIEVSEELATQVQFGRRLQIEVPASPTGILGPAGDLLALYAPDGSWAKPVAVLVS